MSYSQLMKSLDKVTIPESGWLFDTLIIFLGVLLLIIVGFVIAVLIKQLKSVENTPFLKCFKNKDILITSAVALVLVFFEAVVIFAYIDSKTTEITLEDKKTKDYKVVKEWEQKGDLRAYLKTLPKETVLLKDTDFVEEDGSLLGSYLDFKDPKTKKNVTVQYTSDLIVTVREEDLHEDEPQESYVTYVRLPHTITHNYQKGDIVILRITKVN